MTLQTVPVPTAKNQEQYYNNKINKYTQQAQNQEPYLTFSSSRSSSRTEELYQELCGFPTGK